MSRRGNSQTAGAIVSIQDGMTMIYMQRVDQMLQLAIPRP